MARGGARPGAGRPKKGGSKAATPQAAQSPPPSVADVATAPQLPAPSTDAPDASADHLTPKEQLFVAAYCGATAFNATKAYALAGYRTSGSAGRREASKLLTKPRVAEAIAARLAQRVERLSIMSGDEALERISRMGRADIGKVLGPDDPLSKLPDEIRLTIKSVRPHAHGRVIELHDAMRAAELIAKAAGRFVERHEHRVRVGLLELLAPEAEAAHEAPGERLLLDAGAHRARDRAGGYAE